MKDNIKNTYLAADFGGGSGRIIAGSLLHGKLELEEVHRFSNRQVKLGNHVYWDFPALFEDMKTGLKLAAQKGYTVKGIGIDTWGVDFGLIDKNGNLLSNPICYRDARTDGMPAKVFKVLDEQQHYTTTGIQVMAINTLFQLYSMKQNRDPQLEIAHQLLFMPDLFSYFLTGIANNEYCIASTSELLDAKRRNWSQETIRALELPEHLFGEIIQPGTIRGTLKEDIARETGLGAVDVIAVGSHDTASAVAAVPATKTPIAFLSSGTWSLLGVEVNEPILTEEARKAEFTNEGGVGGRIRFLQNITGLWILQRLMSEWKARGEEQHYDTIIPQAAEVETDTIIPVDAPEFMNPENMETALMNMAAEPELYEAVDAKIMEFYLKANELFYEATKGKLDAVLIGNDMGSQRGLMISPEMVRRFVIPGAKKLIKQAHSYGLKVIYHSCGSIFEIIPDLIEAGVDAVHPIQALAVGMEPQHLKDNFGDKVSFCGGVDTQDLLVNGSTDDVKAKVMELRDIFPTGLIISPSHEAIMPDVPPENIRALFDAATELR